MNLTFIDYRFEIYTFSNFLFLLINIIPLHINFVSKSFFPHQLVLKVLINYMNCVSIFLKQYFARYFELLKKKHS